MTCKRDLQALFWPVIKHYKGLQQSNIDVYFLVCQFPLGKAKCLVCYKRGLKAKRGKVPGFPFDTREVACWSHGNHALTCDLLLGADDKIGLPCSTALFISSHSLL